MKSVSIVALFYLFSQSNEFLCSAAFAQETITHRSALESNRHLLDDLSANAPQANLSGKLYDKANSIFQTAKLVHYQHLHLPASEQINAEEGIATTDCSGFISYVLFSTLPRHYEVIRTFSTSGVYPKAKTFAAFFAQLDPEVAKNGWRQVRYFKDLQRGDLIAWKKNFAQRDHQGRGNSGHVMMVVDPPGVVEQTSVDGLLFRYVSINVLDSSSVRHFEPEQLPPLTNHRQRDGIGKGLIRLVINDQNMPIGYWEGTFWGEQGKQIARPSYSTGIYFARVVAMH